MDHSSTADFTLEPPVARVFTTAYNLIAFAIILYCLVRRVRSVKIWRGLNVPAWFIIIIYAESLCFVFANGIMSKSFSLDGSAPLCDAGILLCASLYFSTKVSIWCFFVEKVRLVRNPMLARSKDILYLFNAFAAVIVYPMFVALLIVYRFGYMNSNGQCIIGFQRKVLIPAGIYDALVNFYLTILFIQPLRKLVSYKQGNTALKEMAIRTFFGMCMTMLVTIANVLTLLILNGERHWVCFLACNIDVTFTIIVLQWVTSVDKNSGENSIGTNEPVKPTRPSNFRSVDHPDDLPDFAILSQKDMALTEYASSSSGRAFVIPDVDNEDVEAIVVQPKTNNMIPRSAP